MKQEGTDSQNTDSPAPHEGEEALDGQEPELAKPGTEGGTTSNGGPSTQTWRRREPTILTMQDLIDLPRQILPEETYIHLRNACREASLAAFSLWRSIDKARKGGNNKVRTHIDVE